MAEFIESILFVLGVVVFIIVLPLMWLARRRRARNLREQREVQQRRAQFEERLVHPDYAAFQAHYGCEPGAVLRRLYEDRQNVPDLDFEIKLPASRRAWHVEGFEPMQAGEWADIEGFYAFADDGSGNLYIVNPRDEDPDVFFLDHETGKRERLEVRLSAFLAAQRTR